MTGTPWWDVDFDDLAVRAHPASGRHVAIVTLDLPEQRNAMSEAMTASWTRLMSMLRDDEGLAAVVVTGAGSAFCSGGQMSWLVARPDDPVVELRHRMRTFYDHWLQVANLPVPTIAAINGHAIGAGFALALACDIRYAATEAKVGVPFTALGLHPGMATTWSLPQVAGLAVARDLLLTGRLVSAGEAVELGLASRAVPAATVLAEAVAAAERVAAAAPVATALTLAALRDGGHASARAALDWEALAQAVTMTTTDLHEGVAAARDKRTPRFTGR